MQFIRYTRNLFLRGVSVIFLQAFIVLYVQNSGLYGENGVLPVKNVLINDSPLLSTKFGAKCTLLWYATKFGLNHEYMFDVLCLIGILFSFLGFLKQGFCNKIVFFLLWAFYLSLYHVGQIFVSDLADELLCEVGFLCILIAPLPFERPKVIKKRNLRLQTSLESEPSDSITFWLVRWLLFRVSFSAGIAKMTSKSNSWYHLTAMSEYFETMPLPNVVSWYAHYFPVWFLKTVTVFAEINDIFVPFMFLIPIRSVRKIAFYIQVLMQIGILTSGNYSYYNLLYIVLCLSLLDDYTFYRELALTRTRQWISSVFTKLMAFNAITILMAIFLMMYDFRLTPDHTPEYKLSITPKEFNFILKIYLPYIAHFALGSFIFECLKSLYSSLPLSSNTYGSLGTMITSTMYICVCLGSFSLSTVPLSALHPSVNNTAAKDVILFYNTLAPFKMSNHYVPHQELISPERRREIIIQGANDIKGPWYEYQFLYKPGNVNATPPIIAPYKPLLDRQLFFAAHTSPNKNPWLYGLIYRLLNNQKEVLSLLNTSQNPFVKKPPKFIKVALYEYKFASPLQRKRGIWWNRQLMMPDYLQAMDKNSQVLLDTLKTHKILLNRTPLPVNPYFKQILDLFRSLLLAVDPRILMFTFLVAGFVLILIPSGSNALSI
ncbi:Lipase maturation factor [Cinara cedri]|uniref:Lipase maturation factor n=1 Tax=Cinara cedri TaxID=506608 RepID=A0A5E4NSQ4_9HEMI|nr:Lipase maturation factor [Cinara cedri]